MPTNLSDNILLEKYRQGDTQALGSLIEKYQDRLYSTILKICRNSDDALELSADAFVKVIESIDKFEGNSSFYTWLFRIGVNGAINHVNRKKTLKFASIESLNYDETGVATGFQIDSSEKLPSERLIEKERIQALRDAIDSLDLQHRTIIMLRDIEQMSYEEISSVLSLSIGTVKSRIFRAREALRKKLAHYFEQD